MSRTTGRWFVEGAASISFYTANEDFFGGQQPKQDPIYSAQGHVIYSFDRGLWLALDATYYTDGRTSMDGDKSDEHLQNWRTGFPLAWPINKYDS